MYEGAIVGETLIDFLLTDLSVYEKRIQELFYSETDVPNDLDEFTFILLNAEIYNIAKLLLSLHEVAYLYLFGKLNTVFASDVNHAEQLALAAKVLGEVITLQQIFTDGLVMCCDVDYDSEGITHSGRFLAFLARHQEFMFYHLLTGTAIAATKNGKIDFAVLDKIDTKDKKEQLAIIDKLNEQGANIVSYTLLQGLDEFLYFEFTELLKQGLRVRKCRHCGKYFVLKSQHETFYCDRLTSGNKSCKVIGNKLEYQKKVAADALLQCYERKYKANHAQFGRKSEKEITADEMGKAKTLQKQWSKQAQKMRKAYLEGDISATEFSEWLDKS